MASNLIRPRALTVEEAADVMAVSRTTANREWQIAKSWLYTRLKQEGGTG